MFHTSGLGQFGGAVQEIGMGAAATVIALVLVDIAETEHDAGLRHKVWSCSKVYFLRAVLAHIEDVVHDVGHILG